MKKQIRKWKLFYKEKDSLELKLAKEVLSKEKKKNYKIIREYKNDKRSYIAEIEYKNKKYILKFPYNEVRIPQRKVMTLFKKGEALNTFERTKKYMDKGLDNLCDVYAVGVKREHGMISNSFMIIEHIDGKETQPENKKDIEKLMEGLKKLHSYGLKHGDANPRNFMIEKTTGKLKIIDSQLKNDLLGVGRSYDYINLYYSEVKKALEYTDNTKLSFKIALTQKKLKKLAFISWIKKKKKELRDKGWRI